MINSFQIINEVNEKALGTDSKQEIRETGGEDPLVILKRRFAGGEITQKEYERMRRIIET